jgi:hypothetical protein
MPTKLKWLKLEFFPTNENCITSSFPLDLHASSHEPVWNSQGITAISVGKLEFNNNLALAECGLT